MSTTLKSAGDAIRARFKTLVQDASNVDANKIDVAYENSPLKQPVDKEQKWINLVILWDEQSQVAMGATPRWRQTGIMVAQINVPLGEGDSTAREIADNITTHFRGVSFSSITFRAVQPRRVGRVGNWWRFDLNCPFYIDEVI